MHVRGILLIQVFVFRKMIRTKCLRNNWTVTADVIPSALMMKTVICIWHRNCCRYEVNYSDLGHSLYVGNVPRGLQMIMVVF